MRVQPFVEDGKGTVVRFDELVGFPGDNVREVNIVLREFWGDRTRELTLWKDDGRNHCGWDH